MDLLYLIVIHNKKQSVGSKGKLGPFWTHDVFEFNLAIPIEIGCPHFPSFQKVVWEWKWLELYAW
jgi:hypothetical protein